MSDRQRFVERMRRRLEATGWPRLEMLPTILVTGAFGFVFSMPLHLFGMEPHRSPSGESVRKAAEVFE